MKTRLKSRAFRSHITAISLWTAMLAGLAFAGSANATTVYDAFADFSNTSNSDTTTWSYRTSGDTLRDGAYNLITTNTAASFFSGSNYWKATTFHGISAPNLGSRFIGGASNFAWPDNTLWMHPNPSSFAVLSWLAPSAGQVNIDYSFAHVDLDSRGDGIGYFVDLGDSTGNLAGGSLLTVGTVSTGLQSLLNVSVFAGDRINFIVTPGAGGSNGFDSTAVTAKISFLSVPEPTTFMMFILGLGMIVSAHPRRG